MRDTTRCRRNAGELKLAEQAVVFGTSTLSFIHLNKCTGLVVRVSGGNLMKMVVLRLIRVVMIPPAVSILIEGQR